MARRVLLVLAGALALATVRVATGMSAGGSSFSVQKTLQLANGKMLAFFDLTWVDQKQRAVYVADSGNGSIDIFDAKKDKLITQFVPTPHFNTGPNGMMVTPDLHQIYVGDTPSLTWHIDASNPASPKVVKMISTGGTGDCDEESYDPADG
jgi:DNA-binding beta-propeller fold protein YncE